ncbi:MAG: 23S rRNA (uracil(1939)-C(5))-methyltransferase RlmD [Peptoniphilus sp.]|uniref:23S rRNA (uracil(1939)-C(5))-methyltransferase RlmD n=1 Tax=Peptoniphilus sp. TaxID=1971214 RepID=UPI002A764A76|nr:23S rRNA (uracil(1939)-C(5))-methyltransferase RlmD [Peptoniphilus sp.]MDY2987544.1 23S rRNA (uracil(1939)-C(5))-methyltransferase RlmD [Peptoniphilus sp.]
MKKILTGTIIESKFPNKSTVVGENFELKIKGGIKGQVVEIKKAGHRKGKLINVLKSAPIETENNCEHLEVCGGCTYQKFSYENEIEYKRELLNKLYRDEGFDFDIEMVPSPVHKDYRNKMEYTFSDEYKDGPLALGLHMKNRFYEVVNTTDCNIVSQDFNTIRAFTRDYFDGVLKPYHKMRHVGNLRHLLIRKSTLGEILVNLVTTSEEFDYTPYFEELLKLELDGKIVGIIHTKNDALSDAIVPEVVEIYYGRDYINEEVLGLKFKVSLYSFFQTNTKSAEVLYSLAREMLGNMEDKVLLDLYCGTGTITQIMGQGTKEALGIEIVEEAVEAARENVKLNFMTNIKFIADDVLNAVKDLEYVPDVIVLDPPREGINPKAIDKIIDFSPEKFLYISCNPVTQARDLKRFVERGYKIVQIKALDQFPRTSHVEALALLVKERSDAEK